MNIDINIDSHSELINLRDMMNVFDKLNQLRHQNYFLNQFLFDFISKLNFGISRSKLLNLGLTLNLYDFFDRRRLNNNFFFNLFNSLIVDYAFNFTHNFSNLFSIYLYLCRHFYSFLYL